MKCIPHLVDPQTSIAEAAGTNIIRAFVILVRSVGEEEAFQALTWLNNSAHARDFISLIAQFNALCVEQDE